MTTTVQPSEHGGDPINFGSPPRKQVVSGVSPAFSPMRGPLGSDGPDEGFSLGFNQEADQASAGDAVIMSTKMHTAANNGDTKTIQELLGKGEDPEARSIFGESALHRAVRGGFADLVGVLLDAGADIQGLDQSGKSPLMVICGTKTRKYKPAHLATVVQLLDNGADSFVTDKKGHTALGRAAANGHASIVLLLLKIEGASAEVTDEQGRTPLMEAARGKHAKIVELLLKLDTAASYRKHVKAKVNVQDESGKTPLMFAAAGRRVELVEMLLKNGADPYVEDKQGKNALRHCKKAPDCEAKIESAMSKSSGSGKKGK